MDLPEEIIVNIISRLPVKSLVLFTAVSKRWLSVMLFDKHFANQHQRNNKALTRRVLVISYPPEINEDAKPVPPHLESLDLETSSFTRLNLSFRERENCPLEIMGSCNGLVYIADDNVFYVYNPSTGFVKELPLPSYSSINMRIKACGVGYLPATDDYKVFVNYGPKMMIYGNVYEEVYKIMLLKDQIWRSIEGPEDCDLWQTRGLLSMRHFIG